MTSAFYDPLDGSIVKNIVVVKSSLIHDLHLWSLLFVDCCLVTEQKFEFQQKSFQHMLHEDVLISCFAFRKK